MVKKTQIKVEITNKLCVAANVLTVDSSDSSPKAIAALKAIFRTPEVKENQMQKAAFKIAAPIIKRGIKSKRDSIKSGEKSGDTRNTKADEWNSRVLLTINKVTDEFDKDFKKPSWKDIAARHKSDFHGEFASQTRINNIRKAQKISN
jgi:hypothetical protein